MFILLPFSISVPSGVDLDVFDMTLDGQTARIYPP
jgi:hypothetical protein